MIDGGDESEAEGVLRDVIADELRKLKDLADGVGPEGLKSGSWFYTLLAHSLKTYSTKVDAEFFKAKYPGLPVDAIVDRRVHLAQRYAMVAGGMTAAAYSAAVVATLGSGGGSSPLTVPAAVGAFGSDLFFTTQLQLRLAFDLAILYGHPIDLEDPEDLADLIQVAFGVKAGETLQNAMSKLAPEATRFAVKKVASGAWLAFLKTLPVVGKYLLQRTLIKIAIPVVSIPFSAGMNYWFTGSIAKLAKVTYRSRAVVRDAATKLWLDSEDHGDIVLRVVFMVVTSDGSVAASEASFVNHLIKYYAEDAENAAWLDKFKEILNQDQEALLVNVRQLPQEVKKHVYGAAVTACAVDSHLHPKELFQLRKLAEACGTLFSEADLGAEVMKFRL